jgi:putative FmdB family regulatory protein
LPIYDYRCDECGHRFSVVQSWSDAPIDKCPNCGKRPRKLIVAPAIVFKGSGWYKTDSRTAPKDSDSASSGDSSKKSEPAKSETKSEAKTETKSDAKPADGGSKNEAKP